MLKIFSILVPLFNLQELINAMKENTPNQSEQFPFRKISTTSFIKGGLAILLGTIILLAIKNNLENNNISGVMTKLIFGAGFLVLGIRSVWKGYKSEYNFSLNDIFDTTRDIRINYLLAQRNGSKVQAARDYADIFHSKNFNLDRVEKSKIDEWKSIFFKLVSKKGLSDIFQYVPYPITNFISNQSRPVSLIFFSFLILLIFAFLKYLGLIAFSYIWIILLIFVGLLTLWSPTSINSVIQAKSNKKNNRIVFFVIFYVITILLYRPYERAIDIGLLVSMVGLIALMVYSSLISFKLIESVFSERKVIKVNISDLDLVTNRVATQPNNILQQFENILKQKTGWYFRSKTQDARDTLAGDENRKGDFKYEYLYETKPSIFSTAYDLTTEKRLSKILFIGTVLICLGLIIFFIGILKIPNLDYLGGIQNFRNSIPDNSNGILSSIFLLMLGTIIYFFGNRLVYEIYLFFNTEIFFKSDLILFSAYGNYDEFEHEVNGMKRKDTFTDFTPDIEVTQIESSIFVHPYLKGDIISKLPRFLTKTSRNDELLNSLIEEFKSNLSPYIMNLTDKSSISRIIDQSKDDPEQLSN